jgi:flagellar motor switch protein FliM
LVEILSQAEIEALLSSLSGDETGGESADSSSLDTASAAPASSPARDGRKHTVAYEPYDFRRPDKLSKDQLRTLQMLHETFARLFSSSLSAFLRVSTHVDLVSVEQVPYDEYMRSITSSIINVFSMAPLAGQAILEIEFGVVLSMIDRLLGGPGNMIKNNTNLTDIEKRLAAQIVEKALRELKNAWEGVARFTPRTDIMETQAQFIQIVSPNDTVLSVLFEVKLGELRGAMSLCIPYLLLKPIITKLSAQRWSFSTPSNTAGQNASTILRRLENTSVNCVCRLGETVITVEDLVRLKVGDTITLDRKCTDEVDLMIGGHVKFKGKPGTSGRKVALHINRVIQEERG